MQTTNNVTTHYTITAANHSQPMQCRDDSPEWWWCCQACNTSSNRKDQQQEKYQAPVVDQQSTSPLDTITEWRSMLGLMLSLPPGGATQLGVLRCGVRYSQRIMGYMHALSAADKDHPPLLRGPLLVWDEARIAGADATELAETFATLIDYLRSNNPIVQRYLTIMETNFLEGQEEQVGMLMDYTYKLHCICSLNCHAHAPSNGTTQK